MAQGFWPEEQRSKVGSYIHAESLDKNGVETIRMICFDISGYFFCAHNSQHFPNRQLASLLPSTDNFILVVGCSENQEFTERFHQQMSLRIK